MYNEAGAIQADTVEEQPLWSRANDMLNMIRDDLNMRAATIEGEQKRLQDEYNHVQSALMRIAPPTPLPVAPSYPSAPPQTKPRW